MPGNSTKSVIIFGFTIAIAMAGTWAESNKAEFGKTSRGPASLAGLVSKKMAVFNQEALGGVRHTEKLKVDSDVIIQLASAKPEKAGDIFVLTAAVSSEHPLENIEAKWSTGTATIIGGDKYANYGPLEGGQTRSFSITLRAGSDKNEQIHLLVKTKPVGNAEQSQSAQYNSQNQETIDASNDLQRQFIKTLAKDVDGSENHKIMH